MKKFGIFILVLFSFLLLSGCNDKLVVNGVTIEKYQIHTELQEQFLTGDYNLVSTIATGAEELSYPNPITLDLKKLSKYKENNQYQVVISDDYDFKDYRSYTTEENQLEIYNLKINLVYYWKVVSNSTESDVFGFMIETTAPRNLFVEGLTNVRDLGGWPCGDDEVVKQGMIYRSSKLNDDESTDILITNNGIETMLSLEIKTELDVRDASDNENGGITSSPLGESVEYISLSMKSGGNYLTLNKGKLAEIFKVLGDESKYPMVIHCSIGTDRTGLICFLVNGLLGVSEDNLYRDYLFSNFGNIYGLRTPSAIKDYLKLINYSSGNTLQEKFYNFLVGAGVAEEDLNNVIRIMKGKKVNY